MGTDVLESGVEQAFMPFSGIAEVIMKILPILIVLGIIMLISLYRLFQKAGKPGWVAFVPVYNLIVWVQICDMKITTLLWLFVPVLGWIIFWVLLMMNFSRVFGKSKDFGTAMIFVPFICMPMLAFQESYYKDQKPTLKKTVTQGMMVRGMNQVEGMQLKGSNEFQEVELATEMERPITPVHVQDQSVDVTSSNPQRDLLNTIPQGNINTNQLAMQHGMMNMGASMIPESPQKVDTDIPSTVDIPTVESVPTYDSAKTFRSQQTEMPEIEPPMNSQPITSQEPIKSYMKPRIQERETVIEPTMSETSVTEVTSPTIDVPQTLKQVVPVENDMLSLDTLEQGIPRSPYREENVMNPQLAILQGAMMSDPTFGEPNVSVGMPQPMVEEKVVPTSFAEMTPPQPSMLSIFDMPVSDVPLEPVMQTEETNLSVNSIPNPQASYVAPEPQVNLNGSTMKVSERELKNKQSEITDGFKRCPHCGAKVAEHLETCFLCGNRF